MLKDFRLYGVLIIIAIIVYLGGYFYGYMSGETIGKIKTLKIAVAAQKIREKINHETANLKPVDLCISLGGVPDHCAILLRGMDTPADSQ